MRKYLVSIMAILIGWFQFMNAQVCFVVKEGGKFLLHDGACDKRFSPCSTFKIPLAVIGFDAGILVDEKTPEWPFKPGYVDWVSAWKQAQNSTTWIKNSCVWYSQLITKKLGMQTFQNYVDKFDYGNRDLSGDKDKNNGLANSWLVSSLQISADEQVAFLEKLVESKLPALQKAQELACKILFVENLSDGWKLYGKTGSGPLVENGIESADNVLGWFVGWIKKDRRTVVFAYHDVYTWTGVQPGMLARDAAKALLAKLVGVSRKMAMRKSVLYLPEIKLVGIAVKTNNELELDRSTANIGPIINKYYRDQIAERISCRKKNGTTYCLYTEYESDFHGDYTYIIGEEVTSFENIPQGLVSCVIPVQTYIRFIDGPGPLPALCISMWQKIWGMTAEELGGKRSYLADFEVYDARAQDQKSAEMDVYVGIVPHKQI